MDEVLLGIVLRRLEEFPLPEEATDLLLAALENDESSSAQLGGQAQLRSEAPDITTAPTPAGAYLQSLTVGGFRGIGPPATLKVVPRPGLTLVVGRNGAGIPQAELALRTGVEQSVFSAYEAGRRQPSLPTVARLIDAAGADLVVGIQQQPPQLSRLSGPVGRQVGANGGTWSRPPPPMR
jgi:DNA-binding XRE family transcriptional regulator